MKGYEIMKWVTIILGICLILAPFIFGYSGTPGALWTCLVMGAVIIVMGFLEAYKWAAGGGLVTMVAPWILGFSGIGAALWCSLILGGLVLILAGYRGFFFVETKAINV